MTHRYAVALEWTGNTGAGTAGYTTYGRDHVVRAAGKPDLLGSADPQFRGDSARWNPEELLVAALSACHQLWYLHLAAANGIVVTAYRDAAEGEMAMESDGGGRFTAVTLRPAVTVAAGSDPVQALALHAEAARLCFIARSVAFPVHHVPLPVAVQG